MKLLFNKETDIICNPPKPPRVLIVEDNEDDQDLIKPHIIAEKWDYLFVTCGEEALIKLAEGGIDGVICDLALDGGMDGYELEREMRSHEKMSHIPVVFITGYKEMMNSVPTEKCLSIIFKPTPLEAVRGALRILSPPKEVIPQREKIKVASATWTMLGCATLFGILLRVAWERGWIAEIVKNFLGL